MLICLGMGNPGTARGAGQGVACEVRDIIAGSDNTVQMNVAFEFLHVPHICMYTVGVAQGARYMGQSFILVSSIYLWLVDMATSRATLQSPRSVDRSLTDEDIA